MLHIGVYPTKLDVGILQVIQTASNYIPFGLKSLVRQIAQQYRIGSFTKMIPSLFPLFMITLVSSLVMARAHDKAHSSSLRRRKLDRPTRRLEKSSSVVSTSECENVRTKSFAAKLELEYLYLVESLVPLANLKGVQNVNNRAILDALVTCDDKGFPIYALDLSTPHEDVEQGESPLLLVV